VRFKTHTIIESALQYRPKRNQGIRGQWYALWKSRNEDVHRKDLASKVAAAKHEVTRRLREIYALKNHIEPSARALLCADLQTHLEQPTWVIQNWLAMYGGSYFTASAKTVATRAIQGVPSPIQYKAPGGCLCLYVGRAHLRVVSNRMSRVFPKPGHHHERQYVKLICSFYL
jgi:hypothetical protein